MTTVTTAPEASVHAPRTSWLRRVLGPFYFTGVFWYRTHLWAARHLPEPLLQPVVFFFSSAFTLALGNVRRAIGENLQLVRGPAGYWRRQRWARDVIHTFSWCLTERYEQFGDKGPPSTTIENGESWHALVEAGPFILVTAHIGNWEMGSTLPATREGLVIHIVREPELDARSQSFIEGLLAGLGGPEYVTHFARGDMELGLELLDALRAGEIVALQGDRPRASGKTVDVEMFGHTLPFPVGVAALGRLAAVPLLPVFVIRTGRRHYRIVFRTPIQVARTADREADHSRASQALAREVEWAVREAPLQWFCFAPVRPHATVDAQIGQDRG